MLWALANWHFLTGNTQPRSALDVGCGTGRNTLYLADLGIEVTGFDASDSAIASAMKRPQAAGSANAPRFLLHDLSQGLPVDAATVDFLADVFVYKHQLSASIRSSYRAEMKRVLTPGGRILISLAMPDDGYYSTCPNYDTEATSDHGKLRTVLDPVIMVGSVLFALSDLVEKMSDYFTLEMSWHKRKAGPMHGNTYMRSTLATLWKSKDR